MEGARYADACRICRISTCVGKVSGFQSAQYRILQFTLGNKNRSTMAVYAQQPEWYARLHAPGLYEEFLFYLSRRGMPAPQRALDRDFSELRAEDENVIAVLRISYENRADHWARYETCEALMDIANNFHFWRFHHMKTVERIIGHKPGSGGSSGVSLLKKALDIELFPELIRVRTGIGDNQG